MRGTSPIIAYRLLFSIVLRQPAAQHQFTRRLYLVHAAVGHVSCVTYSVILRQPAPSVAGSISSCSEITDMMVRNVSVNSLIAVPPDSL